MQNLDKYLRCHPEHIEAVIKAFQIYATKNDMDYIEMLNDVTNITLDTLNKKHKKYKKSITPYASITPPCSSYSYYMKDNYNKIKNKLPQSKPTLSEVSKVVSQTWAKLDNKTKKKYEKLATLDKKRYMEEKANVNDKLETNNLTKPKRPKSAFLFFLADERPKIKKAQPGIKIVDISKEGRNLWLNLSNHAKSKYKKISDLDKERYAKEKLEYQQNLELLT